MKTNSHDAAALAGLLMSRMDRSIRRPVTCTLTLEPAGLPERLFLQILDAGKSKLPRGEVPPACHGFSRMSVSVAACEDWREIDNSMQCLRGVAADTALGASPWACDPQSGVDERRVYFARLSPHWNGSEFTVVASLLACHHLRHGGEQVLAWDRPTGHTLLMGRHMANLGLVY